MRKYSLASKTAKQDVDLRDYRDDIVAAVHAAMPDAHVEVYAEYYTVSPIPERGAAIRIGRTLSNKDILGRHCITIPKLFNGETIDIKKECNHEPKKKSCNGGHY